jgi:FkbM family methyltransferase
MFFKKLNLIKYKLVRFIESKPSLNLFIYNNIRFLRFLLPHEKDFYGMLLVCKNDRDLSILDIGANLGISLLGFRQLGFINKIYAFEPNNYLYKNFLKNISNKDSDIYVKNYALGNKNEDKFFYMPYYKSTFVHYFSSFDKEYIYQSIKMTFSKKFTKFSLKKKIIKCRTFDSLKLNIKPHFIKIDTEGFDEFVLCGLKKTIEKFNPIFLIEYNKDYFFRIKKKLNNYVAYIYDINLNRMKKLNRKLINLHVARTNKNNFLSIRNVYFIPKNYKF